MFVGVPIFEDPAGREHLPLLPTRDGWASLAELIWQPLPALGTDSGPVASEHLEPLENRLAEILLLPELVPPTGVAPSRQDAPSTFPLWGRTYYSGPEIGGEVKRWIVVSHDVHNEGTGRSICVRTTSNLSRQAAGMSPLVESGNAVAVCADVVSKGHERCDLESASRLPQSTGLEVRKIARCLVNALALQRAAGIS